MSAHAPTRECQFRLPGLHRERDNRHEDEAAGSSSSAFFSFLGSSPAMPPMIGLETTIPNQAAVTAIPIAVASCAGRPFAIRSAVCMNALPTTPSVVGNTGAIARPAMKTVTQATVGLLLCSIRNVVIAIAIAAPINTVLGSTLSST